MNMHELKAAAELLERWGCDVVASYSLIPEYDMKAVGHAAGDVGSWLRQHLFSDAPVTAEWLRETWGAVQEDHPQKMLIRRGVGTPGERMPIGMWLVDDGWKAMLIHHSYAASCLEREVNTQGQFTLLALGLGLTPKQ